MASGGRGGPRTNALFSDNRRLDEGAGRGPDRAGSANPLRSCRRGAGPSGERFLVTRVERNVVFELGGEALARSVGRSLFRPVFREDQELLQARAPSGDCDERVSGGVPPRGFSGDLQRSGGRQVGRGDGDRQPRSGWARDGAVPCPGRAETADEDLRAMLIRTLTEIPMPGGGGLLFSCNGRGTRMFPEPHP